MTVYARGHDGWAERLNAVPQQQMEFNLGDEHELAGSDVGQQGGNGASGVSESCRDASN